MGCLCGGTTITAGAQRGTTAANVLTGRQYVGSGGFDSPFDIPEPILTPYIAPGQVVAVTSGREGRWVWIAAAVLAVIIYYNYSKRRR